LLSGVPGKVCVTRVAQEEWNKDCLVAKFPKQDSVIIWGGIFEDEGNKVMVIWECDNWGTTSAQIYIHHILVPITLAGITYLRIKS